MIDATVPTGATGPRGEGRCFPHPPARHHHRPHPVTAAPPSPLHRTASATCPTGPFPLDCPPPIRDNSDCIKDCLPVIRWRWIRVQSRPSCAGLVRLGSGHPHPPRPPRHPPRPVPAVSSGNCPMAESCPLPSAVVDSPRRGNSLSVTPPFPPPGNLSPQNPVRPSISQGIGNVLRWVSGGAAPGCAGNRDWVGPGQHRPG